MRYSASSLDFHADAHMWAWVGEEVTANPCFDAATVRAHLDLFFAGLAAHRDEVTQRCRTELQSRADALDAARAAPPLPVNL